MKRKIFFALILLIAAAAIVASADAASVKYKSVDIGGIDFNVSDEFAEDENHRIVNETYDDCTQNGKLFQKADTVVMIVVSKFGDKIGRANVSELGGYKFSVNGADGYLSNEGLFDVFSYAKDGKLVSISTNDKNILKQFIIGE